MTQPSASTRQRRSGGFTLIELIVAVVVIGVGMTYVFMGVEMFSAGSELKASARGLASTIDFCRNEAVSLSETIILEYDLVHQRYRAIFPFIYETDGTKRLSESEGEDETEVFSWTNLPVRVRFERIVMPGNEYLDTDRVRIPFTPVGSTTAHIVQLTNLQETQQFSIEVNPLTGIAQFFDYVKEFETADEADFDIQ